MTTTSTAAWRNLQSKEPGGRREGSGASHGPLDGRWSRPSARAVPTGVVVVYLPCRKDARFSGPRSRRLPACLLVTWLRPSSPGSGVRRAGFCRASLSKLQWGWGGVLARPLKAVLRMGESRRFQKLGPLEHRLQAKAAGDSGLSRGLTRAGVGPRPGHLKPLGHLPFSQGPVFACPGSPRFLSPRISCTISCSLGPAAPPRPFHLMVLEPPRGWQEALGSGSSRRDGCVLRGQLWPGVGSCGPLLGEGAAGWSWQGRPILQEGDRGPGGDGLAQAVGWSHVAPDVAGPLPSGHVDNPLPWIPAPGGLFPVFVPG